VNHSIKITPYWLLGFVEGEGTFNVSKSKDFSLEFGVCQTLSEKKVMLETASKIFIRWATPSWGVSY
jgi:hypothetical protein